MSNFISHDNLSIAWARAIRSLDQTGVKELIPLTLSVTGFDSNSDVGENQKIRDEVEALLTRNGQQKVETVASTIFPTSYWNVNKERQQLFDRYSRNYPRIRKASSKNRHGVYFYRMISGGPLSNENQLDFILDTYLSRPAVRRSTLQLAVFDGTKDHTASAMRGFPCLQQVSFVPVDGTLSVNAFYATQYMVERAYGNYLGLCRLGKFVAHELGLNLVKMNCFTGIAQRDVPRKDLAPIIKALDEIDPP